MDPGPKNHPIIISDFFTQKNDPIPQKTIKNNLQNKHEKLQKVIKKQGSRGSNPAHPSGNVLKWWFCWSKLEKS